MSNQHLHTAYNRGVQVALKEAGYNSPDEVVKEAMEYGLIAPPQEPEPTKISSYDALRAQIQQG